MKKRFAFLFFCAGLNILYGRFGESPFSLSLENENLNFEDSSLKANVFSVRANVSAPLSTSKKNILALTASYESLFYQWQGATQPFDRVTQGRLGLFSLNRLPRKWRAMTLTNLQTNIVEGVAAERGLTVGGIYGAWYEGWDSLLIGGGLGFSSDLNDKTSFFPLLFIDWEFYENWHLTTRPTPGTRFGPGLSLMYEHDDQISAFCGVRYINQEYEMGNDRTYNYSTTRLFSTLVYSTSRHLVVSGTLGINLGGETTIGDQQYDLGASLFVGSDISWIF